MAYDTYPYVKQAIKDIDFSCRHIILGLPPTSFHDFRTPYYYEALQNTFGETASISIVDYPASWNILPSVDAGVEILTRVLAEIQKQSLKNRKRYKIYLIGESQGSWVIGETLSKKSHYRQITRATLIGHPAVAEHHYENDEKILEINHPYDPFTHEPHGDATTALAALSRIKSGKLGRETARMIWQTANLKNLSLLGRIGIAGSLEIGLLPNKYLHNTHCYNEYIDTISQYLLDGIKPEIIYTESRWGIVRQEFNPELIPSNKPTIWQKRKLIDN